MGSDTATYGETQEDIDHSWSSNAFARAPWHVHGNIQAYFSVLPDLSDSNFAFSLFDEAALAAPLSVIRYPLIVNR
jgi:hypothetical protein